MPINFSCQCRAHFLHIGVMFEILYAIVLKIYEKQPLLPIASGFTNHNSVYVHKKVRRFKKPLNLMIYLFICIILETVFWKIVRFKE